MSPNVPNEALTNIDPDANHYSCAINHDGMPESFRTLSTVDYNHLCAQSSKDLRVYCHNIRSFKCNASKWLCIFFKCI